jgi:hypothetical protein
LKKKKGGIVVNKYSVCPDQELFHMFERLNSLIKNKKEVMQSGIDSFAKQVLQDEINNYNRSLDLVKQELEKRDLLKYL